MKQRVISGIFIAAITVISVLLGGPVLKAVVTFIALYGSYEFIKIRKDEFNYILYAIMATAVLCLIYLNKYSMPIILIELIVLMTIAVFDEKESFDEVCSTYLMSILLGYSLYFILYIRELDKFMLGYVLIISYLTDVFAFFVGIKFGKHKLNPRVSPKKTIEGSLGGWFFGFATSFLWASIFDFFGYSAFQIAISSAFLPLVSEIGDLAFSLIKRHYGVKDFSDLIPGHGGILDRLDSHLFCIILFGVLISLF
ncbi:MAG: phosphatidate cytidylyltransferase [Erysipelotrichaceae bacterium]|nr:phosphatidate cytidylyltransferase [Erysipelotrichaceae bacterium]